MYSILTARKRNSRSMCQSVVTLPALNVNDKIQIKIENVLELNLQSKI